jgi:hypothetical protein
MKTSNVKKVLSIVILTVIIAITIATVVLAIVPKNLYNPIDYDYKAITVYKDKKPNIYNATESGSTQDKDVIKNIVNYHKMSIRDSLLSTIFQGTGSFEERVVYEEVSTDCMSNVAKKANTICLIFNYLDEQTLVLNGEECTHPKATGEGKTITYTKLYMPVLNYDDFQECTIYLTGSDNKSNFQIKFLAHQSELFDYLSDLKWDTVNA